MAKKSANPPAKVKTTFTVTKTDSPGALKKPLVHEATVGNRRRWAAWQDWLSVALGAYLALSPLWIPNASFALFTTLGILAIAVAVWAGSTASSTLAEFVQMLLGAITILSGLFRGYGEGRTATLTAWMVGAGLIVLAAVAAYRNRSGRSTTNPHEYQRT